MTTETNGVEVQKGMTMAILSCLLKAKGDPITTADMVKWIRSSGRRTNTQEVASLLVTIHSSEIRRILEIGKIGRSNTYKISDEYAQATLEQLQKVYLKRFKFTVKDLHKELYGEPPQETPGHDAGDVLVVTGKRITLILEDPDTEVVIRYKIS
jgi:hypothetical protein